MKESTACGKKTFVCTFSCLLAFKIVIVNMFRDAKLRFGNNHLTKLFLCHNSALAKKSTHQSTLVKKKQGARFMVAMNISRSVVTKGTNYTEEYVY